MKYLFLLICSVSLLALPSFGQTPAKRIPAFEFRDFNGKSFGNKELVPATDQFFVFFDLECDHCHRALFYLDKHFAEFNGTALYLVTLNKPEDVRQFMTRNGISLLGKKNVFPVADHRNQFIGLFGPRKYPSLFLYSAKQDLVLYDDNEQNLPLFLEKTRRKK